VSRPTKIPGNLRYYSLKTRTYLWRVFSVRKHRGQVVTSREKLDIREPFARQRIFDIVCPDDDRAWNLTATAIDQCITGRTSNGHGDAEMASLSTEEEEGWPASHPADIPETGGDSQGPIEIEDTDTELPGGEVFETLRGESMYQSAWE
jgi:hypothetical protein